MKLLKETTNHSSTLWNQDWTRSGMNISYDTLIHWENGIKKIILHGKVNWIPGTDGEFIFLNRHTKFWGDTRYWQVLINQKPQIGFIDHQNIIHGGGGSCFNYNIIRWMEN